MLGHRNVSKPGKQYKNPCFRHVIPNISLILGLDFNKREIVSLNIKFDKITLFVVIIEKKTASLTSYCRLKSLNGHICF